MKVIFLDIDGVTVTKRNIAQAKVESMGKGERVFPDFDPVCVSCLNEVVAKSGAVIVISSTWRWAHPRHLDLVEFLEDQGVIGAVVDMTPRSDGCRGDEISAWLKDNPAESFVILDDDADMGELLPHLVQTEFEDGLTPAHVDKALKILEKGHD